MTKDTTDKIVPDMSEMWGETTVSRHSGNAVRGGWFRESRFAMFIHWGLYSEPAGRWQGQSYHGIAEWLMLCARIPVREYEQTAARFNPIEFDAGAWVELARAAGMKYIVITAKHHDGFAMFKSSASPFNIVDATPFKRDPLKELAEACRKGGLKLGFYYSQFQDWHEPDADGNSWDFEPDRDFNKYLREKAMPQIRELLTHYGPVALIWFDTPGSISPEASQELVDTVRQLQPDCLVNSRIGNGLGDYATLGDQEIPLTAPDCLWETVDTHNDAWGYSVLDHNWKSPHELISRLVRLVSLGGNYMLNVGPTGKGAMPAESGRILRQVGAWVQRHAESIYGTTRSPLGLQAWGCATYRLGKLFLHVLNWPRGGELWLPLQAKVESLDLPFTHENGRLCITIPELPPESPVTVIELGVSGLIEAASFPHYLQPGLVNKFDAPFAALSHCALGKRSWMERFGDWHHAEVIENWSDGSTAQWSFTALKPGSFYLHATYECRPDADGSEFEMSLGGQRWLFPALNTGGSAGGRVRFRRVRLGLVTIPVAGEYTLAIRGVNVKGRNDFILQTVELEPGDE